MTSELKPCPFCGWDGELIEDGGKYYIECENSACPPQPTTPLVDSVDTAVEDWNTRAVPDVPELVRYGLDRRGFPWIELEQRDDGEYVRYDQAAAMLTVLKAELYDMRQERDRALGWRDHDKERAEAAEAKLHTTDNTIADIANELGCKPDNEEILQTIFDMKSKLAEYEKPMEDDK